MNDRLRSLADKQAITEQLYRYGRAMDRIDRTLGYHVWHQDGAADYGEIFRGTGHEFIDWVCETHSRMIAHAHRLTNILIDVRTDRAVSETYVHATLRFSEAGIVRQASVFGRYLDRWSMRNGLWAIDHRLYIQDMDEVRDAGDELVGGAGRRDPSDPSYALFTS